MRTRTGDSFIASNLRPLFDMESDMVPYDERRDMSKQEISKQEKTEVTKQDSGPTGVRGFLHEVFLDKDDIEHERRFDCRSLPLIAVALAAGWLYSRDGNAAYACVSAVFAVAYAVYFVINRGTYIVHVIRGERVIPDGGGADAKQPWNPAWLRMMASFIDNDIAYAFIGGYGIPLAGTAVMVVYGIYGWHWLAVLGIVLCVVYAAYWLCYAFIAMHRRLVEALCDRNSRLEQAQYRMSMMERDTMLASKTHDTVTGGLSYIAFTAQQRLEDERLSDAERAAWRRIDETAQHTIDNVHTVIDILGHADASKSLRADGGNRDCIVAQGGSFFDKIQTHCEAGDDHLHSLGFAGESHVAETVKSFEVGRERTDECTRLLDELYANIAGHADPSQQYAVFANVENGHLHVTETNSIPEPDEGHAYRKPVSGRGLALHRDALERIGGTLRTSQEDGTWTLSADIPLEGR